MSLANTLNNSTLRDKFNALFDKQFEVENFESEEEYSDYRKAAWHWFKQGTEAAT